MSVIGQFQVVMKLSFKLRLNSRRLALSHWQMKFIFLLFSAFLISLTAGKRKSLHKRIGFLQDPPGLQPRAHLSPVYITFNTFTHSFASAQRLFAPRSVTLPAASTYISMMNTVIQSEEFKDREELAHFIAHTLFHSKGFTEKESCDYSASLSLHSYHSRGYCPLEGEEAYREASFIIYGDDRLLLAPELVSFDEAVNWRTSILAWKKLKNVSSAPESIDKIFQILRSYYLLK